MPAPDAAERSLIAKLAATELWAGVKDRSAHTAPARQALLDRFEREVDPDGTLDPADRAKRAESAKKAFYLRLALKSAQARRARKTAAELDDEVTQALTDLAGDAA